MKLGLVLSGGGARGAFEAGVVAAIEEAGLRPEVLSGTSAGALNVAAVAAGLGARRLGELWASTRDRDVFRLRRDVWRLPRPGGLLAPGNLAERVLRGIGWTWLLHTRPLRRTLVRALGGERVPVTGGVVAVVSAVDKATGELVRFTTAPPPARREDPRFRVVDLGVDHLMASAAIPILFRPATVGRARFWDGGIVANTPLAPALAYEPDAVIVVTTATRERPSPRPASLADAVSLLIDNILAHSLAADLARAESENRLARYAPDRTDRRVVDLLIIEPTGLDLGDGLRFDPAQARRLLDLGHGVGREAIAGWREEGRLPRQRPDEPPGGS